jgi:hypothetical protein
MLTLARFPTFGACLNCETRGLKWRLGEAKCVALAQCEKFLINKEKITMIFTDGTALKNMNSQALKALIEEAEEILYNRKLNVSLERQNKLVNAIEEFQNSLDDSVFVDNKGNEIEILDIVEIYNKTLDCGYTFGIGKDALLAQAK